MTGLRNLGLAAVVVSASVALVFAHDGHDHGSTNKLKSSPNGDSDAGRAPPRPTVPDSFSPRTPIPPDRLPFQIDDDNQFQQPATECESDQCPLAGPSSPPVDDRRRLDPRVVCIRLEFAAELLADDLATELRGACGAVGVLRDAERLVEQARQLRSTFDGGMKVEDVRVAAMTFHRLERSLNGYRVDVITGRDFELTGRLLSDLVTELRNTPRVPVADSPERGPRRAPAFDVPELPAFLVPEADTPRAPLNIPDDRMTSKSSDNLPS